MFMLMDKWQSQLFPSQLYLIAVQKPLQQYRYKQVVMGRKVLGTSLTPPPPHTHTPQSQTPQGVVHSAYPQTGPALPSGECGDKRLPHKGSWKGRRDGGRGSRRRRSQRGRREKGKRSFTHATLHVRDTCTSHLTVTPYSEVLRRS